MNDCKKLPRSLSFISFLIYFEFPRLATKADSCIHHKNKFNQITLPPFTYPSLVQEDLVIYDNLS